LPLQIGNPSLFFQRPAGQGSNRMKNMRRKKKEKKKKKKKSAGSKIHNKRGGAPPHKKKKKKNIGTIGTRGPLHGRPGRLRGALGNLDDRARTLLIAGNLRLSHDRLASHINKYSLQKKQKKQESKKAKSKKKKKRKD
jgi:hypothetical protein